MAQQPKTLADEIDDVRQPLGPTYWNDRIDSSKLFSEFHMHSIAEVHTCTHTGE